MKKIYLFLLYLIASFLTVAIVISITFFMVSCGEENNKNNSGWIGGKPVSGVQTKISTEYTGWTIHVQTTDAGMDSTLSK